MTPKQFKAARISLGHTQTALAVSLGVTSTTISRYECYVSDVPKVVELAMNMLSVEHNNKTIGM